MVATQFNLLKWNHPSVKQREILTSDSDMLAAWQNSLLEHVGAVPKHIHWRTAWCQMQLTYPKYFHCGNFLARVLAFKYIFFLYNIIRCSQCCFIQNHFATKLTFELCRDWARFFLFYKQSFSKLMLVKISPVTEFELRFPNLVSEFKTDLDSKSYDLVPTCNP